MSKLEKITFHTEHTEFVGPVRYSDILEQYGDREKIAIAIQQFVYSALTEGGCGSYSDI